MTSTRQYQHDEFDIYFARAALQAAAAAASAASEASSLCSNSIQAESTVTENLSIAESRKATGSSTPRRSVSCKYPSRSRTIVVKSPSPTSSVASMSHMDTVDHSSKDSLSGRGGTDSNLCAPLLGAWSKSSSSAPQSRSSSWKKMKRPRSYREISEDTFCQQPTGSGTKGSGNLEEAILSKLQELKLLQEEDCCVVRSFSTSSKGVVIRRGEDMFKKLTPSGCPIVVEEATDRANGCASDAGEEGGSASDSAAATGSSCCMREMNSNASNKVPTPTIDLQNEYGVSSIYKVLVIGQSHVGKTALIQQFMTSQYLAAVCTSFDDEFDKTVSVILDGEETMLDFIDAKSSSKQEYINLFDIQAYVLVYSITDQSSFRYAIEVLCSLRHKIDSHPPIIIMVANKSDLVRTRQVTDAEGKCACTWMSCKYIAVSASLCHRVDELLVGIVRQIRLKKKFEQMQRQHQQHQQQSTQSLDQRRSKTDNINECVKGAKELLKELFFADVNCLPQQASNCENLFEL